MLFEGMSQGTVTTIIVICLAMAIIFHFAILIFDSPPWGLLFALAALILACVGMYGYHMLPVLNEDYIQGQEDALSEYDFDKYELCVKYSEKCSDFEYAGVVDTKKHNYCKGYINGYEEKTKKLELEELENDIN